MKIDQLKSNFFLNRGVLNNWWRTVDRVSIIVILAIASFSIIAVTTASPAIGARIGLEPLYFMKRQIIYVLLGLSMVFFFSLMSDKLIKRLAILGFVVCVLALAVVPIFGVTVKGAKRWISLFGISIQPSEFIKPLFAILTAWLFSVRSEDETFPAFKVSAIAYFIIVALLLMQPDFGLVMTLSIIWASQLFISGLSFVWFFACLIFGCVALYFGYVFFPHVARRIDSFLHPEGFENYQINKSIQAFKNGGFSGTGPGEGLVKQQLPDSHTDFIFAVIGEEMGFIFCVLLIVLFAVLILRGLYIVAKSHNTFTTLAVSGILTQIALQSIFNMGVTLQLFPTKGMTLPLVSYGGSSVISVCMALGIMLALTKRKYNVIELPTRKVRMEVY